MLVHTHWWAWAGSVMGEDVQGKNNPSSFPIPRALVNLISLLQPARWGVVALLDTTWATCSWLLMRVELTPATTSQINLYFPYC